MTFGAGVSLTVDKPITIVPLMERIWRFATFLVNPLGIAGVIIALLLWEVLSLSNGARVPGPIAVLGNAYFNLIDSTRLPGIGLPRGGYLPHLLFTAQTVLTGGGIGAIIGSATGLLSAEYRNVNAVLDPIVSLLGTVPIIVAAPFFLMWFGVTGASQVVLVAFYTAIVLHVFAFRAVRNLKPQYVDYAMTLGASSTRRLVSVQLPGILPELFGGLRVAMGAAWGLAAVTEMLGAQFGSGRVLVALRAVYDLTGIMAVVLCLGVFAIFIDVFLLGARNYLLRWLPREAKQ